MRPRLFHIRSLAVAALLSGAGCLYALPGLVGHWRFGSNYDLAIFDQAVWRLSRFEAPFSTVRGLDLRGDHFSPILALLAPLYWIAAAPETLIVAQAGLFAASVLPVLALLRRRVPDGQALALCGAYVLFWGLQRAAAFDFHEYAFAPLLIAVVLLAADARRFALLWAAAVSLALVKEDLLPFLVGIGALVAVRGDRRQGVALSAFAIISCAAIVGLVVPAFNENGGYMYGGSYHAFLSRPWLLPVTLVSPSTKLMTLLLWLAPFAFLPLASPLLLLALPIALSRFLSDSPFHWGAAFHYSAPLAPILAFAAGDGLARLQRRILDARRRATTVGIVLGAALLFSLILPGRQPMFRLFRKGEFTESGFLRSGRQALSMVPKDASVVAQTAIAPHLSRRAHIYCLDGSAPEAEIVIAAPALTPWPVQGRQALEALIAGRRERGYVVIFQENGWIVLRRR